MAKILLVEDDKSLREIYGVRLSAEGYEIVSAGDGEEALAMAIKERPDLIVSDVMMPKISGFDMLDILRSTTETKNVKVIMMTALSSEDQRARGEALGADRYLVKSQVGIEDVVRTVHDVLSDSPASAAAPVFQAAPFAVPVPTTAPVAEPAFAPIPEPTYAPAPVDTTIAPVQTVEPVTVPPAPIQAPVLPQPAAVPVAQPVAFAPAPVVVMPAAVPSPDPLQQPVVASVPPFVAQPAQPAPQAAQTEMPQPTAPFSTPAPASLGERIIAPLSDPAAQTTTVADLSSQINQALGTINDPAVPPAPGTPPTL